MWQNGLCRCDSVGDLEMEMIPGYPGGSQRQSQVSSEDGNLTTEGEGDVKMEAERLEDAVLLVLKTEEGAMSHRMQL